MLKDLYNFVNKLNEKFEDCDILIFKDRFNRLHIRVNTKEDDHYEQIFTVKEIKNLVENRASFQNLYGKDAIRNLEELKKRRIN